MSRQCSIRRPNGRLSAPSAMFSMLALILTLCGCDVPAQIVWSPDGTRAAFRSGSNALLVDQNGAFIQPLPSTVGGFAWSADSQSLYLASSDDKDVPPTPLHLDWLGPTTAPVNNLNTPNTPASTQGDTTQPDTDAAPESKSDAVVSVLTHGKITPLFRLADVVVWYLALSPDGQWLAAMTSVNADGRSDEHRLFVYFIPSGRLYELSQFCGQGACFTGPHEIAFIEANGVDDVGKRVGHIVKARLDSTSASLPRQPLLDVILPFTSWMEPSDAGLIFTSAPRVFPGPPEGDDDAPTYKLYHLTCADGGLTVLADDVGPLFDASPDGKQILFEKLTEPEAPATCPVPDRSVSVIGVQPTSKAAPAHDDLCVMNANGSDPHILLPLQDYEDTPKPPMWPAWRGNGEITFISPADRTKSIRVNNEDRKIFDVIEYRLTEKGTLEPIRTLSEKWRAELKPFCKKEGK